LSQLLEVFFAVHDPTTLNRQGNDAGPQYRSGIYTHNAEDLKLAQEWVAHLNQSKAFGKPVVTEVVERANYWPAEGYHQDYFERNPNQGYCAFVVGPKVAKFQKTFASLMR
jgi:peptide-methionine (S)-S-oxide reductase